MLKDVNAKQIFDRNAEALQCPNLNAKSYGVGSEF